VALSPETCIKHSKITANINFHCLCVLLKVGEMMQWSSHRHCHPSHPMRKGLNLGVLQGDSSHGWGDPLHSFWCCYGSTVESFAKLADSIFFYRCLF
jgi:hypothetical protein